MAVDNTHFKGSWRPEEDAALREAVSRHGEKNWSTVARTFNQLMGRPALLGRAPKQCRSRYLQQLVPGIKTGEWSIEEEEILVEGHKQFGNQWTLIASMLPGRTETSVKNHYNCTARRKVPADPNRMTILQRYLAAIGIISAPGGSKGGSGGAAKYPSLGSGYPNSNSGMYYQGAGTGTTATSSAAAAAAAAAAGKAAASRSRRGTSAPAAVHSPSASHMGYDEYEGTTELAHAYSEADYTQAYAAYQAYQSMEQQQQHMAAAAAAAAAAMQHDHADAEGEDEVAAEGGAADGLLQLAHAAMMHLEELGGEGDDDDEEDEEGEEGAGSGNGEARQRSASKQQQHAAGEECYADNEHEHEQQQHQQVAASSTGKGGEVAAAGSKAGSKSPAGRPLPAWLKPDLALSVMSSEESDRTAEEPDEGSPLAEQLLRQHLKSGSKRGSPSTAAAAALGGRTQPASGAAPGAKRPRSVWGAEEAAVAAAAAAVGAGGSVDAAAAAGALAGAVAGRRFTRPVLDVSEPEGTGSCVPPPLSLPVGPVSPGVPSVGSNSAPLSELNAHLVAMLMGAFMGAADSSAASAPASALPTDALAAIARVMASSLAAAGQSQQQQQHQSSSPPPAVPSKMPASQLAAQGDA